MKHSTYLDWLKTLSRGQIEFNSERKETPSIEYEFDIDAIPSPTPKWPWKYKHTLEYVNKKLI